MPRAVLLIDAEKCTGCRACELICSFYHVARFNPRRSRICVLRDYRNGKAVPTLCRQCEKPACAQACPTEAIIRNRKTGAMLIDLDRCTKCEACISACQFKGVTVDPVTKYPIKCDLCGGNPICVRFCARGAIKLAFT